MGGPTFPSCSPSPSTPTGVFITPQTRLDQAYSLYSDVYKDTYGIRPRGRVIFPASDDEAGMVALADFLYEEIADMTRPPYQGPLPPADTWSDLTYNPFAGLAALL